MGYKGIVDGWNFNVQEHYYTFSRSLTFDATTQDIDLIVPFFFHLCKLEQRFNDATARTWSLRVNTDLTLSTYTELANATASVAISSLTQMGLEYFYPPATRVRLEYSASTAGKTVDIVISIHKME